ncbi:hypothetical protein R3P38DRAFT_3218952 [Favolaschia claudopus]|uniref:Uncharacterized protein n=1 Tax=Favolaschia claudopus TaxID=2862362 RepID=A0AAW0A3L3_9AGAR
MKQHSPVQIKIVCSPSTASVLLPRDIGVCRWGWIVEKMLQNLHARSNADCDLIISSPEDSPLEHSLSLQIDRLPAESAHSRGISLYMPWVKVVCHRIPAPPSAPPLRLTSLGKFHRRTIQQSYDNDAKQHLKLCTAVPDLRVDVVSMQLPGDRCTFTLLQLAVCGLLSYSTIHAYDRSFVSVVYLDTPCRAAHRPLLFTYPSLLRVSRASYPSAPEFDSLLLSFLELASPIISSPSRNSATLENGNCPSAPTPACPVSFGWLARTS